MSNLKPDGFCEKCEKVIRRRIVFESINIVEEELKKRGGKG